MIVPDPYNSTINLINEYHKNKEEKPRLHLGCSLIGHKCDRFLWLSFRWAVIPKFEGRIKRLFRRGQNEEKTVIDDLLNIGVNVTNYGKNQKRVEFTNHISGSIDGVIQDGLIESSKTHILEIKTHSLKSFEELKKNGVEKSKPLHYAQMQLYMFGTSINRALYFAVCKDNDEIYTERVELDYVFATKLIERAKNIVNNPRLPEPMQADPTWFECKFCDCYDFCFGSHKIKQINCRTCTFSTPTKEGWNCERYGEIPSEHTYDGCENHVIHPDLVDWKLIESKSTEISACYEIDGKEWINGEGGKPTWYLLLDEGTKAIADTFDGVKV